MIVHFNKNMTLDEIKNEIESKFESAGIYESYHFKVGNQWFKYSFGRDEFADSPRVWGNAGTMVCWYKRYKLGDEQPSCTPLEWLANLYADTLFANGEKNAQADMQKLIAYAKAKAIVSIDGETYHVFSNWNTETHFGSKTYSREFAEAICENLTCNQLHEVINDSNLGIVILPLYLMNHSGVSMRTYSYNDPWDSGQVGFIYACKDEYEEFTGQKLGEDWKDVIQHELMDEVETYTQYMQNNVYFYSFSKYIGDNAVTESNIEGQTDFDVEDSCGGFYGDDIAQNGILTELVGNVEYLLEKTKVEEIDRDAFTEYVDWLYKTDEYKDVLQDKVLPKMLAGILDYASKLSPDAQKEFLRQCLPDVGENIINKVYID